MRDMHEVQRRHVVDQPLDGTERVPAIHASPKPLRKNDDSGSGDRWKGESGGNPPSRGFYT